MTEGSAEPSRKPDNTNFKQQTLPAWTPTLTPISVIACFAMIGIPFIAIGAILLAETNGIVEYEQRYDTMTDCAITSQGEGKACQVSFDVKEEMKGTVYVYYQLTNFYQNHRTYVKSRSDRQLLGEHIAGDETYLADCAPKKYAKLNGTKKALWPCGLVANSLFDDTFTLSAPVDRVMDEKDIAWDTDIENKFNQPNGWASKTVDCSEISTCSDKTLCPASVCNANNIDEGCRGYTCVGGAYDYNSKTAEKCDEGQCRLFYYPHSDDYHHLYELFPSVVSPIVGMMNEHFIVWMRTAGLPEFRKLYGRIEKGIPADTTVTFEVTNNFAVSAFDGEKTLVITTLSSMVGGKNPFLGLAYIMVGAFCVLLALLFGVKQFVSPRKLGDPRYLQWNDK